MPPLPQAPVEIEYNALGYLLLPGEVARQWFPNDVLVLMIKGDEIWMLPTRGAAAGGLLLKQRNLAGDRSLLAAPYLPDDTTPGRWPGFWDERAELCAWRSGCRWLPLNRQSRRRLWWRSSRAGWIVYLELAFSAPESADIRIERRRIADYATEERARVAAGWIERTADRDLKRQ